MGWHIWEGPGEYLWEEYMGALGRLVGVCGRNGKAGRIMGGIFGNLRH